MSIIIKGLDMPKDTEYIFAEFVPKDDENEARELRLEKAENVIQIDQPWKECSCNQCKHRGTAPYEKPCSVCARNHKDYFEEI